MTDAYKIHSMVDNMSTITDPSELNDLPFFQVREGAKLPTKAYEDDVGYDLYCTESSIPWDKNGEVVLSRGEVVLFYTGLATVIPPGHGGFFKERSGLGKKGVAVRGGVIDPQYRGELVVMLCNTSNVPVVIKEGDRVAQLVIQKVCNFRPVFAAQLPDSKRGQNGFGSSGA